MSLTLSVERPNLVASIRGYIVNSLWRLITVVIAIALLHCGVAWSQSLIVNFEVYPGGDHATLEWDSGIEAGLSLYQIERSSDGIEFIAVDEVAPQGNNSSYIYEDYPLYKDNSRIYYYRIRAIMADGSSTLSGVKSVTLSFSGIQQTWGSIKALFR